LTKLNVYLIYISRRMLVENETKIYLQEKERERERERERARWEKVNID